MFKRNSFLLLFLLFSLSCSLLVFANEIPVDSQTESVAESQLESEIVSQIESAVESVPEPEIPLDPLPPEELTPEEELREFRHRTLQLLQYILIFSCVGAGACIGCACTRFIGHE